MATLIPNASTAHESAEDWWSDLGHCVHTYEGYDEVHPLAQWDDIVPLLDASLDDEEVRSRLRDLAGYKPCQAETALIEYARLALDAARSVEGALRRAVDAYGRQDVAAVLSALDEASSVEMEWGGDPASSALRAALVGEDGDDAGQ